MFNNLVPYVLQKKEKAKTKKGTRSTLRVTVNVAGGRNCYTRDLWKSKDEGKPAATAVKLIGEAPTENANAVAAKQFPITARQRFTTEPAELGTNAR